MEPRSVLGALALLCLAPSALRAGPVVRVAQGELRGLRIDRPGDQPLRTLYAFQGVPYARAPVGQRRFKDPEEPDSWTGVRNATDYGSICIQKNLGTGNVSGEEDCLYLNVFTADPPEKWSSIKRPVLVFLHGGAFVQWNGNMEFARPDPLLRQGLVFVSLNYRLAIMGFMNTEDAQAPGNAALKDQAMALRWVQRNIAAFGGDAGNVTLMGESAGGASVHYHMLSPLSRGLFHGGVSVSGSALAPWASVQRPRRYALALRRFFAAACADLPEDAIVACLQRVDARDLVFNMHEFPREEGQNFFLKNAFLPSVEAPSASSAPFLTAEPELLLKEGRFAPVPYVTGFVSSEGLLWLAFGRLLEEPSQWAVVDDEMDAIFSWQMPPGRRTREAARAVRRFYLGDRSVRDALNDTDTLLRFVQMCSDTFMDVGTVRSARIMAERGASVYVYQFSRDGPIGFAKRGMNVSHLPGVVHGDDMAYVFDFTDSDTPAAAPLPVPASEQPLRERQAAIFANMAKTGNPTPEGSSLVRWPAYTPRKGGYLDMDVALTARDHVLGERLAFWERLIGDAPIAIGDEQAAPTATS